MDDSLDHRRYILAGGSGFLGISLAHHLTGRGASVVILSRRPPRVTGPWHHVAWDGHSVGPWRTELEGADGVVNLAGRSVNRIKTPDHQDEILRSRVEATRVLGEALRQLDRPPPVWVQMSTAHIYGDPPERVCTERSPSGYGLAPFVGQAWEEACRSSRLPQQRRVVLRTGFVLGRDRGAGGGALKSLLGLTRCGLGGRVAHGRQGMSWIHESDLNDLFERGLNCRTMYGIYNASSPQPVSQLEFMAALRRAAHMPIGLPAPAWLVRLGARLFLRTDPDLVLYGRYVVSERLESEGFLFRFAQLKDALADLLESEFRPLHRAGTRSN